MSLYSLEQFAAMFADRVRMDAYIAAIEKAVRPGDTVVQNGTRHRWGNRGTEPAVLAVFITGAHRGS